MMLKEKYSMTPFKNLKVLARYAPTITDDLDPSIAGLVGTVAVFSYHKLVDDEDTPYDGQWVLKTKDMRFGGYWFPESDLDILQESHAD
jgi:hypothetical protein